MSSSMRRSISARAACRRDCAVPPALVADGSRVNVLSVVRKAGKSEGLDLNIPLSQYMIIIIAKKLHASIRFADCLVKFQSTASPKKTASPW